MQDLLQTLQDHDLGHLRILAELWGLDPPSEGGFQSAQIVSEKMLDATLAVEIIESLPKATRQCLHFIMRAGGRVAFANLDRRFGPLRSMGPGRRDREKPWRNPVSPLEVLWYRGLIARAFGDTNSGPMEFVFIPSDLFDLLPQLPHITPRPLGQSASSPTIRVPATSSAVDDATTILAAFRRQPCDPMTDAYRESLTCFLHHPEALNLFLYLLDDEGIFIPQTFQLDIDATRAFLDLPRAIALRSLILAWQRSTSWNDLQHVPHLTCASEIWPNDPLISRQSVIDLLHEVPLGTWWDLNGFIEAVRERQPAFQRPAGDFGSWYLRDARNGAFLHGFDHWNDVDGAFLLHLITGPLHWLGTVDLGKPDLEGAPKSFRLTPAMAILFDSQAPLTIKESQASATIRPSGHITVPRRAVRALRYQIARFTTWETIDEDSYTYRLTPRSLQIAADQGLEIGHILTILENASKEPLPPSLVNATNRWGTYGVEVRIDQELILRVHDPAVLDELRENPSTTRFLGEMLSPTTVVIDQHDYEPLCTAAARIGILIDPPPSINNNA
jgi:hypothetical protein